MSVAIRAGRESDMGFVVDAWRDYYYLHGLGVRGADRQHYREEMARVINRLCRRGEIRIACNEADDDQILGFAVLGAEGTELHFVYVKEAFRKMGIARRLLEGQPIASYTFRTSSARAPARWRFTPRFTI